MHENGMEMKRGYQRIGISMVDKWETRTSKKGKHTKECNGRERLKSGRIGT